MAPGLIAGFLPASDGGTGTQDASIRNGVCTNLSLQNKDLSSTKESDQLVVVRQEVDGLVTTCTGEIDFTFNSITGTAQFLLVASVDLDLEFGWTSPNFSTTPPQNVTIVSCSATITPTTADVSNLVVEGVPDVLTPTLEDLLDGLIGDTIASSGSDRKYPCIYFFSCFAYPSLLERRSFC